MSKLTQSYNEITAFFFTSLFKAQMCLETLRLSVTFGEVCVLFFSRIAEVKLNILGIQIFISMLQLRRVM